MTILKWWEKAIYDAEEAGREVKALFHPQIIQMDVDKNRKENLYVVR